MHPVSHLPACPSPRVRHRLMKRTPPRRLDNATIERGLNNTRYIRQMLNEGGWPEWPDEPETVVVDHDAQRRADLR